MLGYAPIRLLSIFRIFRPRAGWKGGERVPRSFFFHPCIPPRNGVALTTVLRFRPRGSIFVTEIFVDRFREMLVANPRFYLFPERSFPFVSNIGGKWARERCRVSEIYIFFFLLSLPLLSHHCRQFSVFRGSGKVRIRPEHVDRKRNWAWLSWKF